MIYKVLGQTTSGTLYIAGSETVVSLICVCNRSSSSNTYTVTVNGTPLFSNQTIPGNDTHFLNLAITLDFGDTIGVSGTNLSFSAFGVETPFNPINLFSNGEQGAWFDAQRLDTLWSDTAGTIPAVVDDPDGVARMDDLSGNGNHATQATKTKRPILRETGGLYYLDFDGVDDFLAHGTAADFGSNTADYTSVQSFQMTDDTTTQVVGRWAVVDGTQEQNASFDLIVAYAAESLGFYRANGTDFAPATSIADEFGTSSGNIVTLQKSGTNGLARKNGIERQNVTVASTLDSFEYLQNYQYLIGTNGNFGAADFAGRFFNRLFILRALSQSEIELAEQYFASRAGVTL